MTNQPAYLRDLRKLSRGEPKFVHLEAIEQELYASNSDRAAAVMLASFVETALRRLLTKRMRHDLNSSDKSQLFEHEGAVGTFSSKILIAYSFRLIGPITRSDLDIIRILRNEFAHSRMPFDFKTPEVRAVCAQLKVPNLPGSMIPLGYLNRVPHEQLEEAADLTQAKTRFLTACHALSYRLIVASEGPKEGDQVFPDDQPLP